MANKYPQEAKKNKEEIVSKSKKESTHPQRSRRRAKARRLAEARAERTDEQQLKELDDLLGKGKGAKKERARLKNKISKAELSNNKNNKK